MRRPLGMTIAAFILLTASCITVNVPIGGDPESTAVIWTVQPEEMEKWSVSCDLVVQIKDFSADPSAQGIQMTVLNQDGTLNKTATDIWSSRPNEMLPDILLRDMISAEAWGAVLRKSTMLSEDLIVEGFIREFGGRVTGDRWEAVLDVDVTVLDGDSYELLFQENYRFHWELPVPSYAAMAEAMNVLVGIWTEEVMSDIWSARLPIR